jgi:type II secretory pathway pseudopilin PulG
MPVMKKMQFSQQGDTIVEVLIAIAVVSAVLGSAYGIVNRTVNNSQQAKEHSQALKVAEAQLERLRSAPNRAGAFNPSLVSAFCLPDDLTKTPQNNPGISLSATSVSTTPSDYNALCRFSDGTATERYLVAITRSSDIFKVYVSWEGATGGKDLVNLAYRIYP